MPYVPFSFRVFDVAPRTGAQPRAPTGRNAPLHKSCQAPGTPFFVLEDHDGITVRGAI
jgi:hypothetical protein